LSCPSINATYALNLFRQELVRSSGGVSLVLGPITSSSSAAVAPTAALPTPEPTRPPVDHGVTGAVVNSVVYGVNGTRQGAFVKVIPRVYGLTNRDWRQYDAEQKKIADCSETARTNETVTLQCPQSQPIVIDLTTNRVFERTGGAETTLGEILHAVDMVEWYRLRALEEEETRLRFAPVSDDDREAIMTWIAYEVAKNRVGYCYKDTYGRGAGVPLSRCAAGLERGPGDQLCYPECQNGFHGVGPVCWGTCPEGFADIGAFCQKPEPYGRGAGFAWRPGDPPLPNYSGPIGRCEAEHGAGACEQYGALIYPKCRPGFHNAGSNICSPNCPEGMNDTGTGCTKPSYGRGAGVPMICQEGLEGGESGLCYPPCRANFTAVGPVCWQDCPRSQRIDCGGIACAFNNDACAASISDMVFAPINLIASIVTFGISTRAQAALTAATGGAAASSESVSRLAFTASRWQALMDAIENTITVGDALYNVVNTSIGVEPIGAFEAVSTGIDKTMYPIEVVTEFEQQLDLWREAYRSEFSRNTTPAVHNLLIEKFGRNTSELHYIMDAWAVYQLGLILESDGFDIAKSVLSLASSVVSVASIADPTGATAVVGSTIALANAFTHPMCRVEGDNPFPDVAIRIF
jgi:hypothetical protein